MIPRIIHYCWMSDDEWDLKTKKCFESWKKFIPGFEFRLWNFKTLPSEVLNQPTVIHAIEQRKWAFVADYVRIWALAKYGGIYMDLDVELLKPIDNLLNCDLLLGMEKQQLGAHFMGSRANNEFIMFLLGKISQKRNFLQLPAFITPLYTQYFKQPPQPHITSEVAIYAEEYFNPFYWDTINEHSELNITKNTVCIHWYVGGWIPRYKKNRSYKTIIKFLNKAKILTLLRKIRGY